MTNPFALDTPTPAYPAAPPPFPVAAPVTAPVAAPVPVYPQGAPGVHHAAPAAFAGAPAAQDAGDPFSAPAPQTARGPRPREMYGRLLLIIPHELEKGLASRTFTNPDGTPVIQDRMTADVIVLDGGPIHYGGKPEKMPPVPHDKVSDVPVKFDRMFLSSVGLISQCRNALAEKITKGRPGMVLGRLIKGEDSGKGEPPWLLSPYTEPDKAIARQYLANVDPFA